MDKTTILTYISAIEFRKLNDSYREANLVYPRAEMG